MRKRIRNFLIITTPVFLILHFLGWYKYYYDLKGYDKVIHFLAGGCVVLVVLWFLEIKDIKIANKQLISLVVLFFIGLGWEIFEYLVDHVFGRPIVNPLQLGWPDTLGDFLADFIGGFVVLIFTCFKGKNRVK